MRAPHALPTDIPAGSGARQPRPARPRFFNTVVCVLPLFTCALAKLLLPFAFVRRRVDPVLHAIAGWWVAGNSLWMRLLHPTRGTWRACPPRAGAAGTW